MGKESFRASVLTLALILVPALTSCATPPPTPNVVATQVAQALAVGATLTALAPTVTDTPLPSLTPSDTVTASSTPTRTETRTPSRTDTPQPTDTAVPTATATAPPSPAATSTLTLAPPTPTPLGVPAQVLRVIDGDTIEVSIDDQTYKVRYIGIDTPETVHPTKAVEWMGPQATEANRRLVEGQTVLLEKDVSETDKYGRLLRYVWVGELMVNAELVRLGFAQVSTYPPDVRYQDTFLQLQREPRDAGRGLWGEQPAAAEPTTTSVPTEVPPSPEPTAAPERPQGEANVVIALIFYDGAVPRVESDEFAEIANQGSAPANLKGWRLNADDPGQDFIFPDFVLAPGQSCRVYTNEHHPESGGFSFGSGRAIWANKGECGHLFDASGREVSTWCY